MKKRIGLEGIKLPDPTFDPKRDAFEKEYYRKLTEERVDKETVFVPMGFAVAVSAEDKKPCVGTTSLASCAGIAIYDQERRVAGVAHVFFNEKTSGPNGTVVDDPTWFRKFDELASWIISAGDKRGGGSYRMTLFNVQGGARTKEQNESLARHVESAVERLRRSGKVSSVDYRSDDNFRIDARTGDIRPYDSISQNHGQQAVVYRDRSLNAQPSQSLATITHADEKDSFKAIPLICPSGIRSSPAGAIPSSYRKHPAEAGCFLERETGIEPAAFSLARRRSTTELFPQIDCGRKYSKAPNSLQGMRNASDFRPCGRPRSPGTTGRA